VKNDSRDAEGKQIETYEGGLRGFPLRKFCRELFKIGYVYVCLKLPVQYPKDMLVKYFDLISEHDMKNKAGDVKSKCYLIRTKTGTSMLYDNYGIYAADPSNWLMDRDYNGDVTSLRVLNHLETVQRPKLFNSGVWIYKSDLGFDVSQDYNNQEVLSAKGNLGQILYGLLVIANGGWMITKQFTMHSDFTLTMMYLLIDCFDELYVVKPMTSKMSNGETYLIGKGYKRNDRVIDMFKTKIDNFECTPFECELPEWYLCKMLNANKMLAENQIKMIEKGFGPSFQNNADYELVIKKFEQEIDLVRKK
jgi:hypothetical protein